MLGKQTTIYCLANFRFYLCEVSRVIKRSWKNRSKGTLVMKNVECVNMAKCRKMVLDSLDQVKVSQ